MIKQYIYINKCPLVCIYANRKLCICVYASVKTITRLGNILYIAIVYIYRIYVVGREMLGIFMVGGAMLGILNDLIEIIMHVIIIIML